MQDIDALAEEIRGKLENKQLWGTPVDLNNINHAMAATYVFCCVEWIKSMGSLVAFDNVMWTQNMLDGLKDIPEHINAG